MTWQLHIIDAETSGLQEDGRQEVIDLCIKRWDASGVHTLFNMKFRPIGDVAPGAAAVNGYTKEAWATCTTFRYTHALELARIIQGIRIWVGSRPTFDEDILKEMFARVRVPWPKVHYRYCDTASLGLPLLMIGRIQKTGLAYVAEYYGLKQAVPHTAEQDVDLTKDVIERLVTGALDGFARVQ